MTIAPFSFREFGPGDADIVSAPTARQFLPHGRKKEEAPPPPPPPPIFSEDELKSAERDSYQKGFLDGIAEGKMQAENEQAAVDAALSQSVEHFAKHYIPLFNMYREMLKLQAAQLPKIAHAIAKKVAGDALAENAYPLVEEIALRCVNAMMHEPKLTITIHQSMRETLEKKLQSIAGQAQLSSDIYVVGDPNIAPPNCRIEWKNGAMVRDTNQLWQQVEQIVGSMVASAEREAAEICNVIETPEISPQGE